MSCRLSILSLAVALALTGASYGAPIYSQDFDVDDSLNWTVNNNGAGTNAANLFFNYSAVGIPSAPHSSGGTTIGIKIGANLNPATAPASGNIPGISVSPTGKSFSGDYELRFDWWSNYIGPLTLGATGSTMISEYGIMTSGTAAQFPGAADGVYFAATGDGQSATDYRIYSSERNTSYQTVPPSVNPLDAHAVYPATSQNSSAALYLTTFPAGATAPGSQASEPTQTGATAAGSAGFRWHDVTVTKIGGLVSWRVNGILLGTVDTSLFTSAPTGTNIMFGHADTNLTTNASATLLDKLQFTLIDNVTVTEIPEPMSGVLCLFGAIGGMFLRRRSR